MKIPFSPPYIDEDVIEEVTSALRSGWITSGPKVQELEKLMASFCGVEKAVCVNSWTSGAMLVMKWLGIGAGDEVIVPAYTYAATVLAVMHVGATPVLVDIKDDFSIDPNKIKDKITEKTKAIIPVDMGGWPCDYDSIKNIVSSVDVKGLFKPANDIQKSFGRPAIIGDAAHSLGALYNNKPVAQAADIAVFSLNAVKNITTAEGGIICLNLPAPFNNQSIYQWMKLNSLNGQTKDAFTKSQGGQWKYDIVSMGLKANMTDVCAAIGLAQLRKYDNLLLPERQKIACHYNNFFSKKVWAQVPMLKDALRTSSYHVYPLRIRNFTEEQRDKMIEKLAEAGVATNVHFIPIPMLSFFKECGYKIEDYPQAYANYANEISLPLYPQLTEDECLFIEQQLERVYELVK